MELKRRDRARIQTEMVEFIAFPLGKLLNFWSFLVVVVQGLQRNVQKGVMHVQSCCFAFLSYCFFSVPLLSPSCQVPSVREKGKGIHADYSSAS